MYRLKKILILLFFILCSAVIFAELPKAPNILITDNPSKEVITVNALKNRDHAELNITVNKINIKKLNGIELPNGDILISLPETENLQQDLREDKVFYITDSLENFPNISTVNGKKEIYNLKELEDSIVSSKIELTEYDGYSVIRNIKKNSELYLGIVDKLNGNINKIWQINKNNSYEMEKIIGYIKNDNLIIDITEMDNLKTNFLKNKVIFFNLNDNKSKLPKSRRGKRSLPEKEKVEVTYAPNEKSEAAGTRNDNLRINLNSNTVDNIIAYDKVDNKLYTFSTALYNTSGGGQIQYKNNDIIVIRKENGKYYVGLGTLARTNRKISHALTEDGSAIYNFSINKSEENKKVNFKIYSNDHTVYKDLSLKYSDPTLLLAGSNVNVRDNAIRSEYFGKDQAPDLTQYGIFWPEPYPDANKDYAWIFAFKVMYEIDESLYNEFRSGKYTHIENIDPIIVRIRHWTDSWNDPIEEHEILKAHEIKNRIIFSEDENIDLSNSFINESVLSQKLGTDIFLDSGFNLYIDGKEMPIDSINETSGTPLEIEVGIVMFSKNISNKRTIGFKRINEKHKNKTIRKRILFKKDGVERYEIIFNIKNNEYRGLIESKITLNSPIYSKIAIEETSELSRGENIGKEYAIGKAEGTFWQIADFNISNRLKFFGDTLNKNTDNDVTLDSNWKGHIFEKDGLKIKMTFNKDRKAYFEILNWDAKTQDIEIGYESVYQIQRLNLHLPIFNGLDYLNRSSTPDINYDTKTLTKTITNYGNGNLGEFDIKLDNYNIKVFKDINNLSKFNVKIPKKITLSSPDSEIPIVVTVIDKKTNTIKEEDDTYTYFIPKGDTSEMDLTINLKVSPYDTNKLKNLRRNNIETLHFFGRNLKLIEIGVRGSNTKYDTVIDNIEINTQYPIYEESFDIRSIDNQTTVNGTNQILISDSDLLEIYEIGQPNILLGEITVANFITSGYNLDGSKAHLKYDSNNKIFQLTKLMGKDVTKNYQIKIKSFGIVSKIINIAINNGTFKIIDGKNILDFGDFFPGDVKSAEANIKFKNFNNSNISIELKKDSGEMTLNGNSTTDPREKINLSEFKIWGLDSTNPQENKFKIRGVATTNKNTKPGKYRGVAEVIITIIP